jgi:alanyl-tRNA synthetase
MTADKIREKFKNFFKEKDHKVYSSSSLIPEEEDESVLFTTAGMQQFKDWYIDKEKIENSRTVSVQKCFRTSDIDEVGDKTHHTFFEMLGNFSFGYPELKGSYFKRTAIKLAWQFLTSKDGLGIKKSKISATIFKGDGDIPRDQESKKILEEIGLKKISELGKRDNFWGPVGKTGPCGPTVEFFVPGEDKPIEIWNLVFNQYEKKSDGSLQQLEFKGVDTGMGLERVAAYLQKTEDDYQTDLFKSIIKVLKDKIDLNKWQKEVRVITDHIKGASFLIDEDILPSNTDRGYVLRKILRRSFVRMRVISLESKISIADLITMSKRVVELYSKVYEFKKTNQKIAGVIQSEFENWAKTINKGIAEFEKQYKKDKTGLTGKEAFRLHDTYGLPKEIIKGLFREKKLYFDKKGYQGAEKKHKEKSRASKERFKGGLADREDETVKLHTAAHLLMEALRRVLGDDVRQAGQNITKERLRFDFTYPDKLTSKQIEKIEDMVNEQIEKKIEVKSEEMELKKAIDSGARAFFKDRYPDRVTVYSIGNFSKEICLGPHIRNTGELGKFKILKEESSSKGVRRIRAVLE